MNIALVGMGMGRASTLTGEAREALLRADIVIGAERLLAALPDGCVAEKIVQAIPERITAIIDAHPEWDAACVALSGDVGFYSGAKRLLELLGDRVSRVLPGISTPQYFAAKLRRSWQDFHLVSAHGVRCDVLAEVLNHPSVLFLTGGDATPGGIAAELSVAGLADARMTVGENLSSPDECVVVGTAGELADGRSFASLSTVLVDNDKTISRDIASAGIPDHEFVRGKTPMTKREIRTMAMSLLALRPNDIVYDIGAGTGSVAVEAALLARRGRVYAIERDETAFGLVNRNRETFNTYNVVPVLGVAPEALETLPPPDAVFVGGSKGRMREIVQAALRKNPSARLVISAIALETLASALAVLKESGVPHLGVTQVAASRSVARGEYHMLEAENPVFLVSGGGA